MIFWLDAHLSPKLAPWFKKQFGKECIAVRDLGLHFAKDDEIFDAARRANAIVISKDKDFKEMVLSKGPPPKILWITCGNTSNARMQEVLVKGFPSAVKLLESGESLVELTDF